MQYIFQGTIYKKGMKVIFVIGDITFNFEEQTTQSKLTEI